LRILLDTNVWRYIVDADAVAQLARQARRRRLNILVSPAVLYEMLRTSDPELRRRLVLAVTRESWTRLMPEAYTDSLAIHGVMRLRRPEWLRTRPDLRAFRQFRQDWTSDSGFWRRARSAPDLEARFIADLGAQELSQARLQADERRLLTKHLPFDRVHVKGWRGRIEGDLPGWNGNEVEPWRFDTATHWWHGLILRPKGAYRDWLNPFLDLGRIAEEFASWNHLWLHEADLGEVPREWIRWAVGFVQATRKVTPGTPVDNQIATYLPDADVFVTGDRALAHIIAKVREEAPIGMADPLLLRAEDRPLGFLDHLVGRGPSGA
jgi:hypothetical protein